MIDPAWQASQRLYEAVATLDPMAIAPLISPLAADFIQTIPAVLLHGRALDVGTGLGFTAQRLALHNLSVIGLDSSLAMLQAAIQFNPEANGLDFVCADMMQPPFAPASFDLIVASFGLNMTTPRQSLRSLRRLLKPGGALYIQEWAVEDPISVTFDAIFSTHTDADPGVDKWLEHLGDLSAAWSGQMQDVDDYREQLAVAGLVVLSASESVPATISLESAETFIAYKLAWPTYRYRWTALSAAAQNELRAALKSALVAYSESTGQLIWQPSLFRAAAVAQ